MFVYYIYYFTWPRTQLALKNVDKLFASIPESQSPAINIHGYNVELFFEGLAWLALAPLGGACVVLSSSPCLASQGGSVDGVGAADVLRRRRLVL